MPAAAGAARFSLAFPPPPLVHCTCPGRPRRGGGLTAFPLLHARLAMTIHARLVVPLLAAAVLAVPLPRLCAQDDGQKQAEALRKQVKDLQKQVEDLKRENEALKRRAEEHAAEAQAQRRRAEAERAAVVRALRDAELQ